MNVIEIENLTKTYTLSRPKNGQKTFQALKGVSFSVKKGEIFGILGPNGAGKTTTLEIIEGLKKQTAGTVKVLGLNNLENSESIREQIGVQLQSSDYLPYLTLTELLKLFSSFYKNTTDIHTLLSLVNLNDKANEYVKNLSGGQKQRFTIASSLVNKPEIIFLDEPTTGLDPSARRNLWELVKTINESGITVVLTTHYMEEAEYLCNRVAIMDEGKILEIDEPRKLIEKLTQTTQAGFLVKSELDERLFTALPHVTKFYNKFPKIILELNSLHGVSQIVETLTKNKIDFAGFSVKTASLEDVYLDLTGKEYNDN